MTLKIEHVSKTLGTFSLKNVSLEIADGEYFVLLGPTGSGKTVLLDIIMGFHSPDDGRILLDGQDITELPTDKRGIAYVPQNCPLFPHMSTFENIEFGLKIRGMAPAERKKAVDEMTRVADLEHIAERASSTLSGGERQKVALARALVTEPKIVLLDEPLTAIDAEASRSLIAELKQINRRFKVDFLHVTHDQIEAFSLADRVGIMRAGIIMQVGSPNDVFSNPADENVARFLGYGNVFRAKVVKREGRISEVNVDGSLIRLDGELESDEVTIAICPEDIVIKTEIESIPRGWNLLRGKVHEYIGLGTTVEAVLDAGLKLKAIIDKRSFLELSLLEGQPIYVGFSTCSVRTVGLR